MLWPIWGCRHTVLLVAGRLVRLNLASDDGAGGHAESCTGGPCVGGHAGHPALPPELWLVVLGMLSRRDW